MIKIVNINKEPCDIYIGRPSKWGNPFKLSEYSRQDAIKKYEDWILHQPELLNSLCELDNKILGCTCKPQRCHGDILIKLRLNQLKKEINDEAIDIL